MQTRTLAILVAALVALGACSTTTGGTKQTVGTVGGAIAGGVIGSQFGGGTGQLIATGVGVLAGAFVGSEIGASLDRADRAAMQQAEQQAFAAPVGQTISWNNPNSGNYGTYTPVRDGRASTGAYCREYETTVTIDGRTERAYGTACQQADGTWQIVN